MKKITILIALFFTILLSSCNNDNQENAGITENDNQVIQNQESVEQTKKLEKPVIYTSYYPIYFLTKSLIGGNAQVINLVPAGGEPHDFEPTLKQVAEMSKSNMIVLNGLGMESYEEKLLENVKNVPIVILSEELKDLIELEENQSEDIHEDENEGHNHGNIDPHTWLSPKQYLQLANILIEKLEKNGFTNLDKSILLRLETLDKSYTNGLMDCKQNQIVTSHEAFGYLARDYGFGQHAVFGISPEQEPSAKDIASVIDLIKKLKLNYIFSEEFVSPKFTDTIKKETGVTVLNLHPLESLSDIDENNNSDYISIMEKNLSLLTTGLECKK
ncbi:MAG: zinc ABC transporter substrate-binding protein [Candidatus Gracilibacteria bacterium]|nr:zinc ABC transporter substrate-binding protein [Candidatus Gracilibacteria bacterium]